MIKLFVPLRGHLIIFWDSKANSLKSKWQTLELSLEMNRIFKYLINRMLLKIRNTIRTSTEVTRFNSQLMKIRSTKIKSLTVSIKAQASSIWWVQTLTINKSAFMEFNQLTKYLVYWIRDNKHASRSIHFTQMRLLIYRCYKTKLTQTKTKTS